MACERDLASLLKKTAAAALLITLVGALVYVAHDKLPSQMTAGASEPLRGSMLDPCRHGRNRCHPHAKCTPLPWSPNEKNYVCECLPGWVGDGQNCASVIDPSKREHEGIGCHDKWIGDGLCDPINNNATCKYDGGDCCESTCHSEFRYCGVYGYRCYDPCAYNEAPVVLSTAHDMELEFKPNDFVHISGMHVDDYDSDMDITWSIVEAPTLSGLKGAILEGLAHFSGMGCNFIPDVAGEYVVKIKASDECNMVEELVKVNLICSSHPEAVMNVPKEGDVTKSIVLDGSDSNVDGSVAKVSTEWRVVEIPDSSNCFGTRCLTNALDKLTLFEPDAVGDYTIQLAACDFCHCGFETALLKVVGNVH